MKKISINDRTSNNKLELTVLKDVKDGYLLDDGSVVNLKSNVFYRYVNDELFIFDFDNKILKNKNKDINFSFDLSVYNLVVSSNYFHVTYSISESDLFDLEIFF